MRSLKLLVAVLALAILPRAVSAQDGAYVLVLTDGYFQVTDNQPVSLVNGYSRQQVRPGDYIHARYTVAVKAGQQNPCSGREAVSCELWLGLGDQMERVDDGFLIGQNGQTDTMVVGIIDSGRAKGDIDLVMAIRKNGIDLFVYAIPLTVK